MRALSLVAALSSLTFAAELRPYAFGTAGLTMPKTDIDNDFLPDGIDQSDAMGYSIALGGGVRSTLTPQLDLDASVSIAFLQGGLELSFKDEEARYDGGSYSSSMNTEATLTPKMLDLAGGVVFHATPKLGLGAGVVFSIPVGGSYEMESSYSFEATCPASSTTCYEYSDSDSDSDDGDIEDALDDDFDTKPESFASLSLQGEYQVNDRLSMTASFLMPLGEYVSEKEAQVSWSRAAVGFRYGFSIGQ